MSNDPRFVFDANVIVSALLSPKGKARAALDKALSNAVVVASPDVVSELEDVLHREKFNSFVSLEERMLFFNRFLEVVLITLPSEKVSVCRDPRDDKYLELALAAEATALITGDKDLLALHPFREIAILTPEQFLQAFSAL